MINNKQHDLLHCETIITYCQFFYQYFWFCKKLYIDIFHRRPQKKLRTAFNTVKEETEKKKIMG